MARRQFGAPVAGRGSWEPSAPARSRSGVQARGTITRSGAGNRVERSGERRLRLTVQGHRRLFGAADGKPLHVYRADARHRASDSQQQKDPGTEHPPWWDVSGGDHIESVIFASR